MWRCCSLDMLFLPLCSYPSFAGGGGEVRRGRGGVQASIIMIYVIHCVCLSAWPLSLLPIVCLAVQHGNSLIYFLYHFSSLPFGSGLQAQHKAKSFSCTLNYLRWKLMWSWGSSSWASLHHFIEWDCLDQRKYLLLYRLLQSSLALACIPKFIKWFCSTSALWQILLNFTFWYLLQ